MNTPANQNPQPFDALQVPDAALTQGGVEILRCGVINEGLHVTMRPVFDDTKMWGRVLADIAFQLAGVHAQQNNTTAAAVLANIKSAFDAEMNNPPEGITQARPSA